MQDSGYLNPDQIAEIGKFGESVRRVAKREGKLALYIIGKTPKNQLEIYEKASLPRSNIQLKKLDFEKLLDKRILAYTSKKDEKVTITLKGLLILDFEIRTIASNINKMLDDFNEEFFDCILRISKDPLTGAEKAVILTLLGLGAISDEYSLGLARKESEDCFRECVDLAVKYLKSLGPAFVDTSLDRIWESKVKSESGPVKARLRRLNKIEARTEKVYKKVKKGHYLEVLTNNIVDEELLKYLFERVFEERTLDFDEKRKLLETLDGIHNYTKKLFLSNPPYDYYEFRKGMQHVIEARI